MDDATELPISGAELYSIASTPPEGLLFLEREGGILISGDCLQNWAKPDAYFSFFAKPMMRMMGFIKPHNIGPAWLKRTKPPVNQLLGILDFEFEHVLPAHGAPAQVGAKASYRPRIEALRPAADRQKLFKQHCRRPRSREFPKFLENVAHDVIGYFCALSDALMRLP